MKSTDLFKKTIKSYLDKRAADDELFAVSYAKEGKNLDDCITYILNEVRKSGCNGFADDEIYSMAIHYYDEDDLSIGSPITCNVVVNHTVELTEEDKAEARQRAIKQYQEAALKKLQDRNKPKAKPAEKASDVQPLLFDF